MTLRNNLKGYLRYKTITSQNMLPEAQVKNFLYVVENLYSILKILWFLHSKPTHGLPNL